MERFRFSFIKNVAQKLENQNNGLEKHQNKYIFFFDFCSPIIWETERTALTHRSHKVTRKRRLPVSDRERSPSLKGRSAGRHCPRACEWKTRRLHGVRHGKRNRRKKNTSWPPLSHALTTCNSSNYQTFETNPEAERKQSPCDRGGYETSCTDERWKVLVLVGFLWNFGMLCRNTHVQKPLSLPQHTHILTSATIRWRFYIFSFSC